VGIKPHPQVKSLSILTGKREGVPRVEVGGTPFQAVRFIHDWTDSFIAAVCENPVKTK
jgi:hypothetical protein